MSTLTWLIERGCFEDSEPRLIESINKAGQAYELVEYIPVVQETGWYNINHIKGPGPFVFHGSINLGKVIGRYDPYLHLFCSWSNYRCSKYYSIPYLQRLLLNDCGIFYPYGGLREILKSDQYLWDKEVFIRPDSGGKPFSGTVVEIDALDKFFYQAELYEQIKPEDLCLVAPYRNNIYSEYRCIVINDKAVTASRYICNHSMVGGGTSLGDILTHFDNEVIINKTQKMLDSCNYRPDKAFTVDWVITLSGEIKILEFNSFSCAGMYDCDTDKIVKAMEEMLCGD